MTDYGFEKRKKKPVDDAPPLDLSEVKHKPKKSATAPAADELAKAGEDLGYVNREPVRARKPGPKRKEPQDKITINGPARVIEAFRNIGDPDDALWETLEKLVNGAKKD